MEYTQIAANAFDQLQMNAGIVCRSFDPDTGAVSGILGTTTGGVQFNTNPNYTDIGEDMDNVPGGTKQLRRVSGYDPVISGTLISMDDTLGGALFNLQAGPFGFSGGDNAPTHIVPKNGAFSGFGLWLVGDYSAVNESDSEIGATAGFCAIHLLHAINTAGFQWQTADQGKGQFAFEFHGHYDLTAIDTVPYEIYVKGSPPVIVESPHSEAIAADYTTPFPSFGKAAAIGASSWQWQVSTDSGSTWSNISDGAEYAGTKTDGLYLIAPLTGKSGYKYRCIASNVFGSDTSDAATLTVKGE